MLKCELVAVRDVSGLGGVSTAMVTFVLKLSPDRLSNPDLDIRYALPDLLTERSGGSIQDDGYDYASDNTALLLFLKAERRDEATGCIVDVIENARVLNNDLRAAVVAAVEEADGYKVIYPRDSSEPFVV